LICADRKNLAEQYQLRAQKPHIVSNNFYCLSAAAALTVARVKKDSDFQHTTGLTWHNFIGVDAQTLSLYIVYQPNLAHE